ncbi:unnamed protein product [Pipistrellus nathusii]|uniref:Uncharacterized protein n=1 Tax=Pipistrellus nathusii TaxID=59473 RepID=A0ABN9ZUR8_PIPNA
MHCSAASHLHSARRSPRPQRPTGDDRGPEDAAPARGDPDALHRLAAGVFILIFFFSHGLFLLLPSFPLGATRVEESHPISKKSGLRSVEPPLARGVGPGQLPGGAGRPPGAPHLPDFFWLQFGEDWGLPSAPLFS